MNKLYKRILDINKLPRFLSILIIIGINWIFQSLLYMDKTEKIFKLLLDLILIIILFLILNHFLVVYLSLILSILIAHTINWILNGHIFALFKTFGKVKTKPEQFKKYINDLKEKSSNENSVFLVATFGSFSINNIKETSDIDIRIVRKKGFLNGLKSCIFTMEERSIAFFNKFPLDIYLLDGADELYKLKEDPILIYSIHQSGLEE